MNQSIVSLLCRLCAAREISTDLAEKDASSKKSIITLATKHLKIRINDKQPLPQRFCAVCIQELETFDAFNKKCHSVQDLLKALSGGAPLTEDQKQLLPTDLLEKVEFAPVTVEAIQKADLTDPYYSSNNEDDFEYADDPDYHDDQIDHDDDYDEEIPLAVRAKRKTKPSPSEPKRKRGRPRKDSPKVPPIRIKAVKVKKSVASVDTPSTSENNNTQYEIREDGTKDPSAKTSQEPRPAQLPINDDDENFDYNDTDDLFADEDFKDPEKAAKKNPFALFEFKCHMCQEIFKNFSILKRHCKKEHSASAYVNCVCGKQLRARTAIIEHRRKHTGTSLYKCDTCNKTFNRRSLMCLHMISHMPKDEQPYVCCKCAKRFHTSSLLKKHEKVHLPEEERFLDVCNICQKKFTSKSAVNAHLRAVHYGEKPFVCEHCGNSFSSKAILTDHLTTHSSYAPWPCNVCGRNFKSKYRLNVHMDMHRSVKYRCPHCPMELSTRRTLRMHLLVHKEEKAYVCKVCSKAFRRSKDLKNHSNLHTGRRPYRCEFCERTFANGSNCRAHKLRMHPEELGVEKNSRSSSKQSKQTNNLNLVPGAATASTNKPKNLTTLTDVVKSTRLDYTKYDTKYEFPAGSQDLNYSTDFARFPLPLNLHMKKPEFMELPDINPYNSFTGEVDSDVSKVHHFLSYT